MNGFAPRRRGTAGLAAGTVTSVRRFVVSALVLFSVLTVVGCFPTWRRQARSAFLAWYRERKAAYEELKEEAQARGWVMYVQTPDGIGLLDLGRSRYESLHRPAPGRAVCAASQYRAGRIAFIECEEGFAHHRRQRSKYGLGVLGQQGAVTTVPVDATFEDKGVGGIALGEAQVLFASVIGGAYLYDIEGGLLRVVSRPGSSRTATGIRKVLVMEPKYLVLITGAYPSGRMLLLEAKEPFGLAGTVDNVADAVAAGTKLILQRASTVFIYDPITGTLEPLTLGNLVCGMGADGFLFCQLGRGTLRSGTGTLYRYTLSPRRVEEIWRADGPEFCAFLEIFASPDQRFVFIPLHRHDPPVFARLYTVYDLDTHERHGELFVPFEGRFHFRFLGWASGARTGVARTARKAGLRSPCVRRSGKLAWCRRQRPDKLRWEQQGHLSSSGGLRPNNRAAGAPYGWQVVGLPTSARLKCGYADPVPLGTS